MKKIAVIGGGITGLTTAFQLQQAGMHPLIFESQSESGGSIRTTTREGYTIEGGPNSLQDSPAEVGRLVQSLDLEKEVVQAGPAAKNRYIIRGGAMLALPSSPPALIRSRVLSWKGKLRLLKEPFIAAPKNEIEENLAAFARRRLGEEVLDYLVNPFIAGVYAGDPERLSVKFALPKLLELEEKHGSLFHGMRAAGKARKADKNGKGKGMPRLISFRNGLATIPCELTRRLRQQIYLETTVESITAREGKWEVLASRHGRHLRDTFDAVVLALPPKALAKVQFKTESEEEDPALNLLAEISQPPVASLSLGFDRKQIEHPLDGFGVLFPEKEKRQTLGTLFPSTLFPDRTPLGKVLLTTFIGGTRQPASALAPEADLIAMALSDLRPLLGITGEPEMVSSCRWPHAIPQYEVGYGRFRDAIENFERSHHGVFVAGSSLDGISLGQCIASGFRHAERAKDYLT